MENFTIPNTSKKCVGLVKMLQVSTQQPIQLKELVKAFSIFVVKVIGYQKGSPSEFVGGTQWRIQDGAFGANAPPPFKKLHTRSRYSNRAVNYSNKAVTMFMRQCSLPMKL